MTGDVTRLTLWARNDLPPKWDGRRVGWSEWNTDPMFVCGRPQPTAPRCEGCGSAARGGTAVTTAPRIHLHVLIDVRAQSARCDHCGARHRVHGYQNDPGRVLRILQGFADDHELCRAGRGLNGEDKR